MNNQEQYFLVEKYDPKGQHATVKLSNREQAQISYHLGFTDPIKQEEPIEFDFAKPYPRKAIMADYHYYRFIVFSNRVKAILEKMNISGINYIDAEITDKKGEVYDEYSILHIRKRIACFCKEKSVWTPPAFDPNVVMSIDGMCLDMDKLEEIPLKDRLVFGLAEKSYYTLFHESVVDAIASINPTGLRFVSVGAWHSNIGWELNT
ncbi:hypothetical protein FACS1894159_03070 [Bacteroidia bacterium]|nr:hypothetical protein FACS1894159_03070 [Bacteroidia bacterium]